MGIVLHWFLPTNGDSRTDLSLGNAVGAAGSRVTDGGSASAADERCDLSRHWRNARTHASHDPADWKYHHVGNYLLNDVLPPNHGQI